MKRFFFIVILFSLLMAGCMPLAAVPVSSTSSGGSNEPTIAVIPADPTEEVLPVEPDGSIGGPAAPSARWVAYLGTDGNIWLVNAVDGEKKKITSDAATFSSDSAATVVIYQSPRWSSDGLFLAFERQIGTPNPGGGYDFAFALMVYDFDTGETKAVMEGQQTAGFAWRPGTHLLSFALAAQPGYFVTRGGVDSSLATGISAVDVDTMSPSRLVAPENGFSLVNPVWSPDGMTVSFDELLYMEGRGNFAFYDFAAGRYTAWNKAIGGVSWAPDGSKLLADYLNYMPNYTERVFQINRDGSSEVQLSPDAENGYAYNPIYSPDGSQIAYVQVTGMEPDMVNELVLIDAAGVTRPLTRVAQIFDMNWTPDGQSLLIATGMYPDVKTVLVSVTDGSQVELADGWQAVMRP